jgi:hypothetical protein
VLQVRKGTAAPQVKAAAKKIFAAIVSLVELVIKEVKTIFCCCCCC